MLRARVRGISLIELVVASLLVMLLMGELWMLLQTGSRFYLKARSQTELQRDALISLRWMSGDLAEGAARSFKYYHEERTSNATDRIGFSFGSPKDMNEEIVYGSGGNLSWPTVLGYYIEPGTGDLYRVRVPRIVNSPGDIESVPQIRDDYYHVAVMANSSNKRKLAEKASDIEITQGIQDVTVKLRLRDEKLGFGLSVRTRLEMKNK